MSNYCSWNLPSARSPSLSNETMASTCSSSSTGSQSASDGMGPLSDVDTAMDAPPKPGTRAVARDEAWAKHLPTLRRLYVDEGKTLKQVMDFMETVHNFKASYDDSNTSTHATRFFRVY